MTASSNGVGSDATKKFAEAFRGKNVDEARNTLSKLGLAPSVQKSILEAAKADDALTGSLDEIDDGIKKIGNNSTVIDELSNAFRGLGNELKNVWTSYAPIMAAGAAFAALLALIYQSQNRMNHAMEKAEKSISVYDEANSSLKELETQVDSTRDKVEELASKYNVKISGADEVEDIIANIEKVDTLTLSDEADLSRLKSENTELQNQLTVQKQIVEEKRKEMQLDAENALSTKGTKNYLTADRKIVDSDTSYVDYDYVDVISGTKDNAQKLADLKTYKNSLYEDYNNAQTDGERTRIMTTIKQTEKDIDELNEYINTSRDELLRLQAAYEPDSYRYKEIEDAIQTVNDVDLTPAEREFNLLKRFFDGHSGIGEALKDLVDNGIDAEDALNQLGLSKEDLGIDDINLLNRYLEETAIKADDASDAIKGVDGSVQSLQTASDSADQDATWNSVSTNLNTALTHLKEGKIGTDNVAEAAQFIMPKKIDPDKGYTFDAQAYAAALNKAKKKIKRYFDAENPLQSATNFQNDLLNTDFAKGLGQTGKLATKSGNEIKWNFESSAEAAKSLGLSLEATEVLLHNLETYGAEFNIKWNGDELNEYKESLQGLESIYEEMEEGSSKDRLHDLLFGKGEGKDKILGYKEQLQEFEGDLSEIPEELLVEIKFEYELADLEKKAQELKETAELSGENKDVVEAVQAQKNIREELEKNNKYEHESDKGKDKGYRDSYKRIDELKQSMVGMSSEERAEINNEILKIEELQTAFQKFKWDNRNNKELKGINWKEYLKTEDAHKEIERLMNLMDFDIENKEHVESFAKMLGVDPDDLDIKFKADLDAEEAEKKLKELESREVKDKITKLVAWDEATYVIGIWEQLEASPKFAELSTEDKATYVVELWNSLTPEQKKAYMEGKINIIDDASGVVADVEDKIDNLPVNPTIDIKAINLTKPIIRTVKSDLEELDNKTVSTYIKVYKRNISSGDGPATLIGTTHNKGSAFLSGTAYSSGSTPNSSIPSDAFTNNKYRTKKDEIALIGERKPELVVFSMRLYIVICSKNKLSNCWKLLRAL